MSYERRDTGWLAQRPFAHRGLHDLEQGRPENTVAAALAAVQLGYGIEADLQISSDGIPVVFHDLTLDRLTAVAGDIRQQTAQRLANIRICGTGQTIASLEDLLETVAGRTGLLLELKGLAGEDSGFAEAVARSLSSYSGKVAVMSFNHWLLRDFHALETAIPLGLTAQGDDALFETHRSIDNDMGFDFLSYGINDLPCRFASRFRKSGRPVITWTVRSVAEERFGALHADQITFEGYLPRMGGA